MDTGNLPNTSTIPKKNNSITYLNLTSFLTIYIILFSYIFVKKYEINTFILLSVFHGLFTILVIHLLSTYPLSKMNYLTGSMWTSIFVSMILSLVSVTFLLSTYKYFDDKYTQFGKPTPFTKNIEDMINDYKIMLITTISLIIFMLFVLVGYTSDLDKAYVIIKEFALNGINRSGSDKSTSDVKKKYFDFAKYSFTQRPISYIFELFMSFFKMIYDYSFYIFIVFLEIFNLAIITMSSYGVKMSNDFMLYKQYTYTQ